MPTFRGSFNDYDVMPWGKWKGELLLDIPAGYFRYLSQQDWLIEHPALHKYVTERDWGDEDDGDGDDSDYRK